MRLMTDRRMRHLPVVQGERVLGVLSIGDLVRAVLEEQQRTDRGAASTTSAAEAAAAATCARTSA